MMFSSSDNVNPDLHPSLLVEYIDTTSVSDSTLTTIQDRKLDIDIYPNPSSGIVNMNGLTKDLLIKVYDAKGSIVKEELNFKSSHLDLNHLENGIYFIHINQGGKNFVEKLILNK